ncbi:MAG: hypothetical protein HFJ03_04445 [Lachnospira sp.]|nr:hypothetical protein [Lachnospira sp.]
MSNLNETNKEIDNVETIEEDNINEETENINNQSDLEEKKRTINKLNANNNWGQNQAFINSVDTIVYNVYKQDLKQSESEKSLKKYDLSNSNDCTQFVEKYKYSEYLAMAIILSTFEAVLLADLPDLQKTLMEYLPIVRMKDNEEKEEEASQPNPYVSLNTILMVINGKKFVTEDGQICIGFGESSIQILINILEQFPMLRSSIVSWLIYLSKIYKYRTVFDIYQIATAFARIVSLDITDAKMRILPQLYSSSNNIGLLGVMAYKLYINNMLIDDVECILLHWIESDNRWIWKSVCLAYAFIIEKNNHISIESDLKKALSKKILYLKGSDLHFIVMILHQSKHCRTMIAEIFNNIYNKTNNREEKILISQQYINLIRYCYYIVDASFIKLPLVACDSKSQQICITKIIGQIMSVYYLRKQLYAILGAYLHELSSYNFSQNIIGHISAFFYNIILSSPLYKQDVLYFLTNCKNEAAKQVFMRLNHI